MKEKRFYQVLVMILVLLNIGIISFFLLSKNPAPERNRRRMNALHLLDQRLNLNPQQRQIFDSLRRIHFSQMKSVQQGIMQQKRALYREMRSENIEQPLVDSITHQLGALHQKMEKITFQHFREMRQHLQPQQAARYDSLVLKIFRRDPPRREFRRRRNP